jgi:hypothetical protein
MRNIHKPTRKNVHMHGNGIPEILLQLVKTYGPTILSASAAELSKFVGNKLGAKVKSLLGNGFGVNLNHHNGGQIQLQSAAGYKLAGTGANRAIMYGNGETRLLTKSDPVFFSQKTVQQHPMKRKRK